jgi:hypothetical protein
MSMSLPLALAIVYTGGIGGKAAGMKIWIGVVERERKKQTNGRHN